MPSFDPYILQPMTLLDAVNICLRAIGSTGVLTLDTDSITPDAEIALKSCHDWSIQVQQKGWTWNTERAVTIDASPHSDLAHPGEMVLPANCLKADTAGRSGAVNLVQRGRNLYDPIHSTYDIGQFYSSVTCRLVVALDFEDIPQAGRNYIAAQAALTFATGRLVNSGISEFLRSQAIQALVDLEEAEDEADDETLYEKNRQMHSWHRRRKYN